MCYERDKVGRQRGTEQIPRCMLYDYRLMRTKN